MLYDLKDGLSRSKFAAKVRYLWENGTVVELTDKRRRTGSQNAYLHLALGALAVETGNPLEVVKQEVFKRRCNPDLFVVEKDDPVLGRITVLRSSRDLTKEQMSVALDRYLRFCADNGVYIPSPEDRAAIDRMEYEIAQAQRYL